MSVTRISTAARRPGRARDGRRWLDRARQRRPARPRGAAVAVCDVRLATAQQTVEILEAEGHTALAVECDVRDEASVNAMVAAVIERFGRIDMLHNNAGVLIPGSALTQRIEDWDLHFAVNVKGVLLVSRAVIPHMQRQGGGGIVNTGSTASLVVSRTWSPTTPPRARCCSSPARWQSTSPRTTFASTACAPAGSTPASTIRSSTPTA